MGEVKPMIADTSRIRTQQHARRERKIGRPAVTQIQQLRYRAVWRSKQLIILPLNCHPFRQSISVVLENDLDQILACLKRSPVKRMLLSPKLPKAELQCWIDLASKAGLPAYIRQKGLVKGKHNWLWRVKQASGRITLLWILLILAPALGAISLSLLLFKGQIFERTWKVGASGRVFQELSFALYSTELPAWLRARMIIKAPRMINWLCGHVWLWEDHARASVMNAQRQRI